MFERFRLASNCVNRQASFATAALDLDFPHSKHHYLQLLGFQSGCLHSKGKAHKPVARISKQNMSSDE